MSKLISDSVTRGIKSRSHNGIIRLPVQGENQLFTLRPGGASGARARHGPPSRPLLAFTPHPHLPLLHQAHSASSALVPSAAGWAPGHVTEPQRPVLGPQPHPLARRALLQMGGGCRKESLGPSSSRRGGMSCRPGRDFPSLSNKIPGEQAAGFGRAPAGDPPSPARMPGSPGPGSSGFPRELGGPQNSSRLLPGFVGKSDPSGLQAPHPAKMAPSPSACLPPHPCQPPSPSLGSPKHSG